MLAGVRLVVIDSDFHRGDETILKHSTSRGKYRSHVVFVHLIFIQY